MKSRALVICAVVAVLAFAAFFVGYFSGGDTAPEASLPGKPAKAVAPSVPPSAASVQPVQLSPEEAKRRAERMKEREAREKEQMERRRKMEEKRAAEAREAEIEKLRQEDLPDELRYKYRPKLPKHLQKRIDAERELRHIKAEEKRHPERAEALKARREELEKTLAELKSGRKATKIREDFRSPENVPEQIKENKQ